MTRKDQRPLPRVTIGMPIYNGGADLVHAIESALAQDYPNLQILISDNVSTDGTAQVCRRYLADPRIRYEPCPKHLLSIENFRRVLDLADGEYFTWLAHDDRLPHPDVVRRHVEYLEANPDVVSCGSDVEMVGYGQASARNTISLSMAAPDRGWSAARGEFFRWPQKETTYIVYGMHRRAELASIDFSPPMSRGKPIENSLEVILLMGLASIGRVVALPEVLREIGFRLDSEGQRVRNLYSGLDDLTFSLRLRWRILRTIFGLKLPLGDRLSLLKVGLGNLLRHNLGHPESYPVLYRRLTTEIHRLRKTIDHRRSRTLRRMKTLAQLEGHERPSPLAPLAPRKKLPSRVWHLWYALHHFFHTPDATDKARFQAWYQECDELRQLSAEALVQSEQAQALIEACKKPEVRRAA
jgi:glycosyltransferase involved in cell wall biosynthesis